MIGLCASGPVTWQSAAIYPPEDQVRGGLQNPRPRTVGSWYPAEKGRSVRPGGPPLRGGWAADHRNVDETWSLLRRDVIAVFTGARPDCYSLRVRRAACVVAFVLVIAGCGSLSPSGTRTPLPAGPHPSTISRMICRPETETKLEGVVGVSAAVSRPTWVQHLYSCDYRYANGTMVLSVKEVSSWRQTMAYFAMVAKTLGKVTNLPNLGQGAFQGHAGSVVVRKDWKILLVNVADLPNRFGSPPASANEVAASVAAAILSCWSGD